jgi:electron transport complex protein RnfG
MTDIVEPAYRKHVGYQAILLGGFATLAAALLAVGNLSTRDAIAQRQADDVRASLSQVVPARLHDNNLLKDQLIIHHDSQSYLVYRATQQGKVTAVAYPITGTGYSGTISLIMGVNAKGEILGVRVLAHSETPGLGDKIEEKKDDWIFSFNGLSFDNTPESQWAVKKDGGRFDQFSGATITPRGVVKAVKEGLEFFNAHRAELLAAEDNATPASKHASAAADKGDNTHEQ